MPSTPLIRWAVSGGCLSREDSTRSHVKGVQESSKELSDRKGGTMKLQLETNRVK